MDAEELREGGIVGLELLQLHNRKVVARIIDVVGSLPRNASSIFLELDLGTIHRFTVVPEIVGNASSATLNLNVGGKKKS